MLLQHRGGTCVVILFSQTTDYQRKAQNPDVDYLSSSFGQGYLRDPPQ